MEKKAKNIKQNRTFLLENIFKPTDNQTVENSTLLPNEYTCQSFTDLVGKCITFWDGHYR